MFIGDIEFYLLLIGILVCVGCIIVVARYWHDQSVDIPLSNITSVKVLGNEWFDGSKYCIYEVHGKRTDAPCNKQVGDNLTLGYDGQPIPDPDLKYNTTVTTVAPINGVTTCGFIIKSKFYSTPCLSETVVGDRVQVIHFAQADSWMMIKDFDSNASAFDYRLTTRSNLIPN